VVLVLLLLLSLVSAFSMDRPSSGDGLFFPLSSLSSSPLKIKSVNKTFSFLKI
jgi:hypothetical protein